MPIDHITRRRAMVAAMACVLVPNRPNAAPTRYRLDPGASRVGFSFHLAGARQSGTMPVTRTDVTLDPSELASSRVEVVVDVTGARTGLGFATQAMLSREVLDARNHPTIRFRSTNVNLAADGRLSGGATLTGDMTIRGVTLPVTLNANVFRAPGSDANDLSRLTVQLEGQVSRAAFGATGFSDLVADTVGLHVTAVIHVAD